MLNQKLPTSTSVMSLQDVHLTLDSAAGPIKILRGVSVDIKAGDAIAIVGPSGSGKSTMMAVLGGLERPTRGAVTIEGRDLSALSEDALAEFRRSYIGIVFQSFHLIPTMTALENVAVPLELAGCKSAFDGARDGLDSVGLGHRFGHYPAQLSGGEQQRVALARAFSNSPDVVLADEPTGNLDGNTGQAIMDLLFSHREKRGTTLVLITHDLNIAARCDRILHISDGQIIDENRPNSNGTQTVSFDALGA